MRAAAYVLCSLLLGVGFSVFFHTSLLLGAVIIAVTAFTLVQLTASDGPRGPRGRHRR